MNEAGHGAKGRLRTPDATFRDPLREFVVTACLEPSLELDVGSAPSSSVPRPVLAGGMLSAEYRRSGVCGRPVLAVMRGWIPPEISASTTQRTTRATAVLL